MISCHGKSGEAKSILDLQWKWILAANEEENRSSIEQSIVF